MGIPLNHASPQAIDLLGSNLHGCRLGGLRLCPLRLDGLRLDGLRLGGLNGVLDIRDGVRSRSTF